VDCSRRHIHQWLHVYTIQKQKLAISGGAVATVSRSEQRSSWVLTATPLFTEKDEFWHLTSRKNGNPPKIANNLHSRLRSRDRLLYQTWRNMSELLLKMQSKGVEEPSCLWSVLDRLFQPTYLGLKPTMFPLPTVQDRSRRNWTKQTNNQSIGLLYFSVEQNVTEYNECKNTSIKSKNRTGMPTLLQLKAFVQ